MKQSQIVVQNRSLEVRTTLNSAQNLLSRRKLLNLSIILSFWSYVLFGINSLSDICRYSSASGDRSGTVSPSNKDACESTSDRKQWFDHRVGKPRVSDSTPLILSLFGTFVRLKSDLIYKKVSDLWLCATYT